MITKKFLFFFWWGASLPTKKYLGPGYIYLGLVDSSRNRLASKAYFAKPGFNVFKNQKLIFFFKNGKIYMKDAWNLNPTGRTPQSDCQVQFLVYESGAIKKMVFKSSTGAGKFNGASIKILISCNA